MLAGEFNLIKTALNYLYENIGQGGSSQNNEVRIGYAWFYPINSQSSQEVFNGQEFRGFTDETRTQYVTGVVTDAENFDIEAQLGCKIFTDIKEE